MRENIPKEAPFTIGELEEIYPAASARSKEDEEIQKPGSGGHASAAAWADGDTGLCGTISFRFL